MEKFEQLNKNSKDNLANLKKEIFSLSDSRTAEVYSNKKDNRTERIFIKNKNGEIVEFSELIKDKNSIKNLKKYFTEKGITLNDKELDDIASQFQKKVFDNLIHQIDEDKDMEN